MTKRVKKKLRKRENKRHYIDYYVSCVEYDYLVHKYGKDVVDDFYAENANNEYVKNLTIEFCDKFGRIFDIKLYRNCYPYLPPIVEKDTYTFTRKRGDW